MAKRKVKKSNTATTLKTDLMFDDLMKKALNTPLPADLKKKKKKK